MKLNLVKKIAYCLASVMLIFAFVFNISVVPVKAAEVSSLPADAGVEVVYDSDNIYLTYNGESWSINRNTLVNSNAPTEYNYPLSWSKSFEIDHFGNIIPCSYWFSPHEKKVYIFCSNRFAGNSQYKWFYDESYCYKVLSYSDGSFCFVADNVYSSRRSRCVVYQLDLFDMSVASYSVVSDVDGVASIQSSGYPDDLVCIYSNYTISGFFEPKPADVCYTPDYYFDYQYLFYVENVGYTFVDSALPLVSISNPDPTQALLEFKDVCNKHIYTSVDGIVWNETYTVSGMYSDNASLNYKWFYDSVGGILVYQLIYCNDGTFDEDPIIPPEYGDITDISNNLNNIVRDDFPFGGRSLGVLSDIWLGSSLIDLIFYSNFVPCYYVYSIEYDDGVVEWYCDFDNKTVGSSYSPDGDRSGSCLECIKILTVYGYLDVIISDIEDMLLTVSSMRLDLHSDLKSVFNNISNTNLYLKKIRDDIDGLPNYFEKFNELINLDTDIKQLLSSIDNKLTSGGSSSGSLSGSVVFDDTAILDQLTDVNSELDTIRGVSIADTLVGITGMLAQLTDINFDLDIIKAGYVYKTVDDVFDDFGDDFTEVADFVNLSINSLFGNDGDMATPVLENTLNFDSQVVSGTVFINGVVMKFWDVMGPMQTVTLLGASFFVLHMVIRKGMF